MAHFGATGEPEWSTTDAEVEVYDHDILDAGEYRGHTGYRRWPEDRAAAWSEFSLEPEEFIDAGDRVVVRWMINLAPSLARLESDSRGFSSTPTASNWSI